MDRGDCGKSWLTDIFVRWLAHIPSRLEQNLVFRHVQFFRLHCLKRMPPAAFTRKAVRIKIQNQPLRRVIGARADRSKG
jgi:hypothetical protein